MRDAVWSWLPLILLVGCANTITTTIEIGPGRSFLSEDLSACDSSQAGVLALDPRQPLTVIVHGCNSSAGRFRTLSKIFEAHGQQTICFNYDDRARIAAASARLIGALASLEQLLEPQQINVLGHSQGGLVARRALIHERPSPLRSADGFSYRLVTVSSPFGGIESSIDCGRLWLHILSLGLTVAVCQFVAGNKWTEIYPGSAFIEQPGTLNPNVTSFLHVITDERDSCRRRAEDASCAEKDFVFSLEEQHNAVVDGDERVASQLVKAGHVEIVGEQGVPPAKLIEVLQQAQILAETPPEREEEIASLVRSLY